MIEHKNEPINPDELVKTTEEAQIELSEKELERVAGGQKGWLPVG